MDCNKDEAARAKIIAEKMLSNKDYIGAKKFILKAQNLYPELDGISQILTTVDVYIASENKVSDEMDWYGILGVNPNDDDETIRKNYRKLALILHPDKNKSVGADGAFKLLSEAWSLLYDKHKRTAYNQRRSMKIRMGPGPGSVLPVVSPSVPPRRTDTFWTICNGCRMHYEYLNLYLNHTLLCPNCSQPFLAKERSPPNLSKSAHHHYQKSTTGVNSYTNRNGKWDTSSITSSDPFIASKAASVVQQVNDRLIREREESFQMSTGNGGVNSGNLYRFSNINNSVYRNKELNYFELRHMLIKKAQIEIRTKLSELNSDFDSASQNIQFADDQKNEDPAMSVPDPDFHNYDLDRTENSFEDNQVWACYDDDDGMPRFYSIIHKVLSRKPLKMKISWLNSKTTSEFGSFNWLGHGFRKTLGEFRIGKHEIYKSLNSFSQKVEWKKSPRGSVIILPRKGQVWALYRNWSADWNESIPDDVVHKYDIIQVLEDYNEEQGVPVGHLVKFTGFRTVFHPHTYKNEVKLIPKEEMFRFSHQVPKCLLTGSEAHNSPNGCLELDPAATPLDLIQQLE
ncbi:uncharacterized protein [Rutidosis leptorrhynchoides]|uniref:uncharacterized protein n=1 Tax=Rutidosis leptorrhynchoides TaxID=125765 RepID=UPI003A997F2B